MFIIALPWLASQYNSFAVPSVPLLYHDFLIQFSQLINDDVTKSSQNRIANNHSHLLHYLDGDGVTEHIILIINH